MKPKRLLIFALATILLSFTLGSAIADQPDPGSQADPIVTKSYVDNYIDQSLSGLQKEINDLERQVAQLEEKVAQKAKKEVITLQIGSTTAYRGEKAEQLDAAPYLSNGTTMLPFAFIGEALDAKVGWIAESKSVTFESEDTKIELKIGSKTATINGKSTELDAAPEIKNNRTLVPLRFVSVNLGAKVDWIPETKTINITP